MRKFYLREPRIFGGLPSSLGLVSELIEMLSGSVPAYVQILGLLKRSWYEGDCEDQPCVL